MNNQAAQTMPSNIVERLASAKDKLPAGSDERNAIWQAIEYFRSVSQTAGVAEGWRTEIESILSDAARGGPPVGRDWCCLSCGKWTPINHPEAHAHEDDCAAKAEWDARLKWKSRLHAMLAAAPAASGGESAASVSERDE